MNMRERKLAEVHEAIEMALDGLGYAAEIVGRSSPALALRVVRALEATAAANGLCEDLAAGRVVEA